jgi:thioredoxin reductase (NADPH)
VLTRAGEIGVGLFVVLAGRIEISRRDATGQSVPIIAHDPGQFVGEVAQLSGRPSLVDVKALTDVEVLQIAPDRLRAVLIAEAELGEKIMRALILRRVSLIETGGGGPVIIGRAIRRRGHPAERLPGPQRPPVHAARSRHRQLRPGADRALRGR